MSLYQHIGGWFSETTAGALEALIKLYKVSQVIEIGSFQGRSAVFFASHVLETVCIDPFVAWKEGVEDGAVPEGEDFFDKFEANIKEARSHGAHLSAIRALRKTSEEAFYENPDLQADLIYIDGAHDYESVKKDIWMWKGRARKILCGDDYDEHWEGVVRAVDEAFPDRIIIGNLWVKII